MKSNDDSNLNFVKYLAFLSFSRFKFNENQISKNLDEIKYNDLKDLKRMIDCYCALGGDGFACLSSGLSLFSWPEEINEIIDKFNDSKLIDLKLELNNCGLNNLSSTYGDVYSASLGSVLHELCHTLDLGHEKYGIMGREFNSIKNYFLNTANQTDEIKWFSRSAYLILSNHRYLNSNLKHFDVECLNVESISLNKDELNHLSSKTNSQNFYFDKTELNLKSRNGIILIEYRDSNSLTIKFTEFNLPKKLISLASDHYFKNYKNKQNVFSIIILDRCGFLFKFL